jgi:hypothetical protein
LGARKTKGRQRGQDRHGPAISLDGFIADDNDGRRAGVRLYGDGDVTWALEGADDECRTTQASADFVRASTATWRRLSSDGDGGCST